MNKEELKNLVKKHFNLVEAETEKVETEVIETELSAEETNVETDAVENQEVETKTELSEEIVSEETFGEISTADGELTLVYEGEEISVGIPIFVKTEDGNIPAPDGEHALEGGIIIETEGGNITEIKDAEIESEEDEVASQDEIETGEHEEEMSNEEEVNENEEVIKAVAEIVNSEFASLKKEIEELKTNFASVNGKVDKFALQPAAEKTKADIYSRNTSKVSNEFNPINEDKQKQFDRLLKIRNKK
jgi:hypothetical protein